LTIPLPKTIDNENGIVFVTMQPMPSFGGFDGKFFSFYAEDDGT